MARAIQITARVHVLVAVAQLVLALVSPTPKMPLNDIGRFHGCYLWQITNDLNFGTEESRFLLTD
jgi:hypothetical protein